MTSYEVALLNLILWEEEVMEYFEKEEKAGMQVVEGVEEVGMQIGEGAEEDAKMLQGEEGELVFFVVERDLKVEMCLRVA